MAQKDLISFLKKLDSELTKSSKHYRQAQANKRAHIFRFNSGNFAKQVKIQAAAQDIPLSNDDRKFINTAAEELLTKLKRSLPRIKADEKKITSGKTFIRMTFTSSVKKKSQYGDPDSIYGKIYDTYRPHLKKCFTNIQNYLKEQEFTNEEIRVEFNKILDKFKVDNNLEFFRLDNVNMHLQGKKGRNWDRSRHMRSRVNPCGDIFFCTPAGISS